MTAFIFVAWKGVGRDTCTGRTRRTLTICKPHLLFSRFHSALSPEQLNVGRSHMFLTIHQMQAPLRIPYPALRGSIATLSNLDPATRHKGDSGLEVLVMISKTVIILVNQYLPSIIINTLPR